MLRPARVMIMAGSDSGGGAGIQADLKSVTALGGFASTAITALTAQNTRGVQGVRGVEPDFIREQMISVLADIGTDGGKTGMLHSEPVIETVAQTWQEYGGDAPLVVDPVMVAQSGDRLLAEEAVGALCRRLIPMATVVTPNRPEAEVLAGRALSEDEDPAIMAGEILSLGCHAVLLKGGHAKGDEVVDVLVSAESSPVSIRHPRVAGGNNHGTGCTLASAVAAGLAEGRPLEAAVRRGRDYLQRALETAPGFGSGPGPVHHAYTMAPVDPEGAA